MAEKLTCQDCYWRNDAAVAITYSNSPESLFCSFAPVTSSFQVQIPELALKFCPFPILIMVIFRGGNTRAFLHI